MWAALFLSPATEGQRTQPVFSPKLRGVGSTVSSPRGAQCHGLDALLVEGTPSGQLRGIDPLLKVPSHLYMQISLLSPGKCDVRELEPILALEFSQVLRLIITCSCPSLYHNMVVPLR